MKNLGGQKITAKLKIVQEMGIDTYSLGRLPRYLSCAHAPGDSSNTMITIRSILCCGVAKETLTRDSQSTLFLPME